MSAVMEREIVPALGWAVVTTRPMAEEMAAKSLRAAGRRVYLPVGRKILRGARIDPRTGRRVRSRSGEIVMRPVFVGYLFAEIHAGEAWWEIRAERGVTGLLMARPTLPSLVTPGGIEIIRAAELAGEFDEPRARRGKEVNHRGFEVGDRVAAELGGMPLQGVIHELNDNDTGIVGLMIFGRETRVEKPLVELELVTS